MNQPKVIRAKWLLEAESCLVFALAPQAAANHLVHDVYLSQPALHIGSLEHCQIGLDA
jgi:hypothetical protein